MAGTRGAISVLAADAVDAGQAITSSKQVIDAREMAAAYPIWRAVERVGAVREAEAARSPQVRLGLSIAGPGGARPGDAVAVVAADTTRRLRKMIKV
jgi:hypothetical protein